jgi:hypothetical protein
VKLSLPPSPPKSTRVWSAQQEAIFTAVERPALRATPDSSPNLVVVAVAGSGKTTTLVEACKRMKGQVAFAAYNKKIADEIKVRVSEFGHVNAGTFHSFGFAAWRAANVRQEPEGRGWQELRILASQLGHGLGAPEVHCEPVATAHAKQVHARTRGRVDELWLRSLRLATMSGMS